MNPTLLASAARILWRLQRIDPYPRLPDRVPHVLDVMRVLEVNPSVLDVTTQRVLSEIARTAMPKGRSNSPAARHGERS